ncbi:MAG TPA: MFS transporter, partial [Pseudolysinimonas sp.]|nr:MFS transporter [Pseudolysinimonas sp.]
FLDGTIVTVALPAIVRELGGGIATQQWVVDAYLITLGALILIAGSISDVYGRIRVIRVGVVLFGLTSLAIALSPTAEFLIVVRAAQGVAGALLVPSSLALITSNFRGPAQARAIGLWTAVTSGGMIVGPLLGGLFVDTLSWRYAFAINVVPIAVVLVLLVLLGQKDEHRAGTSIDYFGAALCTIGLGGPVFALIEAPNFGWGHPAILSAMIVGLLSFAGFLIRQRLARDPMMPLSLFVVRNFWVGNIATALIYGALSLNFFVLGVYLQQGAGLSATLAGLAALPSTVIMVLFSSRFGALAGTFGPRLFMGFGPIIMGLSALLFLTVSQDFNYWWQILPGIVLFGFGLTLTVSPLTSTILGAIETSRSGIASAVNNAVARVAGLVATALVSIIVGGSINLVGFHRAVIVSAGLLIVGGVVSLIGIRNAARIAEDDSPGPPGHGRSAQDS